MTTRQFNSTTDVEEGLKEERDLTDAMPAWIDNDAWQLASQRNLMTGSPQQPLQVAAAHEGGEEGNKVGPVLLDLSQTLVHLAKGSRVRAAWDYVGAAPDELSFKECDMFLVVGTAEDAGWLAVEVEGGGEEESAGLAEAGANKRRHGIVPLTHVHVVDDTNLQV